MRSDFSCVFTQHIVLIKKQIKTKKIKMFRLFSEACVGKAVWQWYGKATKSLMLKSNRRVTFGEWRSARQEVVWVTRHHFLLQFLLNGSTTFKKKGGKKPRPFEKLLLLLRKQRARQQEPVDLRAFISLRASSSSPSWDIFLRVQPEHQLKR